ncbi:MAG: MFS transporter, partial [Alphaproteobacteria bacterium]|nr:MFS transporter [Alphaproteobacteria bacterium]
GSVLAYAAGALFGASWGQFYAHTPIVLAALVEGPARTRAFLEFNSYALLGVAVTPLLARALAPVGGDEVTAMHAAAGASLLAASCIAVMGRRMAAAGLAVGSGARAGLSLAGIRAVAGSSAAWVVLMIGMGAVAFSGMHAFQTSFALKNGLDFSVFFVAYTLTVVAVRLIFAGLLSRLSPYPAIAAFLALMSASEALFAAVAGQPLLYALAAVLFALGYGLTYPMLTAVAADEAPAGARDQCLLLVTFAYYVGGFGFPFVAGWIVVTAGYDALLWTLAAVGAAQCAMALWRWRAGARR